MNRCRAWRWAPIWIAVIFVALGCAQSPTEVFEDLEQSASRGNAAEFAAHFTAESRPFAEALMSLYSTHASARGPLSKPLEILAASTVKEESIKGPRAFVTVESPNGTQSTLVFKMEDGEWKLDIGDTEKRNRDR
ncbi:MAG: hypothetical protein GXP54_03630 [Deltaproteobacteria bacterium]|nr:hypothetical protein [Deltaproteobacteria bacterium]